MNVRRLIVTLNLAGAVALGAPRVGSAQCCLNDLFAGFHSCFYKAPQAYAVAPLVAPVAAPAMAPRRMVSSIFASWWPRWSTVVMVFSYGFQMKFLRFGNRA